MVWLRSVDLHWRGVCFWGQNIYNSARRSFHSKGAPSTYGQVDPLQLAEHFAAGRPLEGIHIYRGMPSPHRDAKGFKACRKQVHTRPLQYRKEFPKGREKGIDVQLAVDYVKLLILDNRYTAGVIFSADTEATRHGNEKGGEKLAAAAVAGR